MHLRPLRPRDPHEAHRAATPLELFFDLAIVIAVASVTEEFHHAIAHGHGLAFLPNFVFLFLAIWWAWMNFTWFASSFDNDDPGYRGLVFVTLAGVMLFAGGVAHISEELDFGYGIVGWIVMRVGMIGLWLRAARGSVEHRRAALTYAAGIAFAQLCWTALYIFVPARSPAFFGFGMLCFLIEWSVPVIAEQQARTPWHRHHLVERYGLLTIIVLGEILLSVSRAFGMMYDPEMPVAPLAVSALSGLVIVFVMFWVYFSGQHFSSTRFRRALEWGYGHVFFFGAVAALGAGLAAETDVAAHTAHLTNADVAGFVGVPLALAWGTLWLMRDRHLPDLGRRGLALPVGAAGALALAALGAPIWAFAGLSGVVLVARVPLRAPQPAAD